MGARFCYYSDCDEDAWSVQVVLVPSRGQYWQVPVCIKHRSEYDDEATLDTPSLPLRGFPA